MIIIIFIELPTSLESALKKGPSSARIALQNCMIMRKAVETYYNLAVSKNTYLLTVPLLSVPRLQV